MHKLGGVIQEFSHGCEEVLSEATHESRVTLEALCHDKELHAGVQTNNLDGFRLESLDVVPQMLVLVLADSELMINGLCGGQDS